MSLNPQEFTDKTNNVLNRARELATENSNTQYDTVHLICTLLEDENGLISSGTSVNFCFLMSHRNFNA